MTTQSVVAGLLTVSTSSSAVASTLWQDHGDAVLIAFGVVAIYVALTVVFLLERRRRLAAEEETRTLTSRLIAAQEAERERIAREIHDGVVQEVALFAIEIDGMRQLPAQTPELRSALARLRERTSDLCGDLHSLSHGLHPRVLQHGGLVRALRMYCDEVEARGQLRIFFYADNGIGDVPTEASLAVYRIAQEALSNIVRHARAHSARVSLARNGAVLELTVVDDGQGFKPLKIRNSATGLGLSSMAERARLLHGNVSLESRPSVGTIIRARIPCMPGTPPVSAAWGREDDRPLGRLKRA